MKERRFLYFTKKGPIEVVFNFKHYISAFIIGLIFLFKALQLTFLGASTFFLTLFTKIHRLIIKHSQLVKLRH